MYSHRKHSTIPPGKSQARECIYLSVTSPSDVIVASLLRTLVNATGARHATGVGMPQWHAAHRGPSILNATRCWETIMDKTDNFLAAIYFTVAESTAVPVQIYIYISVYVCLCISSTGIKLFYSYNYCNVIIQQI